MTRLIDDCPKITMYGVGDCEMLERANGAWVTRSNIRQLLDWVMEHDDRDVMLQKLAYLKEEAL